MISFVHRSRAGTVGSGDYVFRHYEDYAGTVYDLTQNIPSPSAIRAKDTLNCPYSGGIIALTLPKGTYDLDCWGAKGGIASSQGGNGGHSHGRYVVTASTETLYLVAGGHGVASTGYSTVAAGGYNGGGDSHSWGTSLVPASDTVVFSGGGASHIARRTGLLSDLESYKSSVLIAAGGGGGTTGGTGIMPGGNGGGEAGANGSSILLGSASGTVAGGGTQSAGGNAGIAHYSTDRTASAGSFGRGGDACAVSATYGIIYKGYHGIGGGGGGWYGGGGGAMAYTASSILSEQYAAVCGAGGSGHVSSELSNTVNVQEAISTCPDAEMHGYIKIIVVKVG